MPLRISLRPTDFNTFINNSDDHLLSNRGGTQVYVLLGLTITNANDWHNKRLFWRDTLYPKYSNADTRTTTVIKNVRDFIKDFRTLANPLLNICAASPNAIQQDATVLNFKIGRKTPTRPTEPISAPMFIKITSKGQGEMRARCRTDEDATRASIPATATSVELRYKVGSPEPQSVNECNSIKVSTRALFNFNVDADESGKKIYLFARWIDNTNEARAGAWGDMISLVIG